MPDGHGLQCNACHSVQGFIHCRWPGHFHSNENYLLSLHKRRTGDGRRTARDGMTLTPSDCNRVVVSCDCLLSAPDKCGRQASTVSSSFQSNSQTAISEEDICDWGWSPVSTAKQSTFRLTPHALCCVLIWAFNYFLLLLIAALLCSLCVTPKTPNVVVGGECPHSFVCEQR